MPEFESESRRYRQQDGTFLVDPDLHEHAVQETLNFLDGKSANTKWVNPGPNNPNAGENPKLEIPVEVGDRAEAPKPGEIREGPGITLIAPDDDGAVTKKPYGTVLTPGGRRRANN